MKCTLFPAHTTQQQPDIFICHLEHTNGSTAAITNYGAIVMSWKPLVNGAADKDLVLGFDTVAEYDQPAYRAAYPYFGAVIGRYANRIKDGRFTLNNKVYETPRNLGSDTLHGGRQGFDSKLWQITGHGNSPEPFVTLSYTAADGEEGFPGSLTTSITYRLEANGLRFAISCTAGEAATVANLAQHTYFNLNGGPGDIAGHKVKIYSSDILAQDEALNCNGHTIPVQFSAWDFSRFKTVQEEWNPEQGYDQSFLIDPYDGQLQLCAECMPADESLCLKVFTTQPVVHFYTGRWIPEVTGKNGQAYGPYSGLCFETQVHPNAVNIPHFPSTILQPGETVSREDVWEVFSL